MKDSNFLGGELFLEWETCWGEQVAIETVHQGLDTFLHPLMFHFFNEIQVSFKKSF